MLTPEFIQSLATREGVRQIAVENFLITLNGMTYQEAVGNCELDAASYRWNYETQAAIREGIIEHFRGVK